MHIKHAAPDSTRAHEAYFGCPVHFESDREGLLVSRQTLDAPNRLGDATIAAFFDTHLDEELGHLDHAVSLERQVRDLVTTSLSEGVPLLSDVAGRLAMSGRTLQRRLADRESAHLTYDPTRNPNADMWYHRDLGREVFDYIFLRVPDGYLAEVAEQRTIFKGDDALSDHFATRARIVIERTPDTGESNDP